MPGKGERTMTLIKKLGFAMPVVVIAFAFIATGTAGATALCESGTAPCPETETLPDNQTIEAELVANTKAVLVAGATTVECAESEWTAKSFAEPIGEVTGGEVSAFSFASCTPAGCVTFKAIRLPYAMEVEATGGGNGTAAFSSGGSGPPALEVNCGAAVLECTFTFMGAMPFEVIGAKGATAEVDTTKLEMKGKLCPKTAKFTAKYKVTTPASLFIANEVAPPVLCEVNTGPCPAGKSYATGTAIKAELESTVKFVYTLNGVKKEPTCPSSKIVGKTETASGRPIFGKITEWKFPGGCGGGLCETTALHLPYRFEIDRTNGGNGTIRWLSSGGGGPSVRIKCSILEDCTYGTSFFEFGLKGSATAPKFNWPTKIGLKGEAGALCSTTATLEGIGGSEEVPFKFTEPTALFVTS